MQLLNEVKQKVAHLASENASTLLTAGGVVGTVTTAILTGRAVLQAAKKLETANFERVGQALAEEGLQPDGSDATNNILTKDHLSRNEKALLIWPYFVPPIVTGTATIASIIMANRISAQKAAALAAAYGLAERNLSEYKEKVTEKLTGPKSQAIDDELAQDRVSKTAGHDQIVVVEGDVLCFDEPTGRYFNSTMENIKSAVNATNEEIINHDHARATFFYEEIGLPATTWTDEVGWNRDHLLDLKYSTVMAPNNRPCIAIDFKVLPKLDYVPKHY